MGDAKFSTKQINKLNTERHWYDRQTYLSNVQLDRQTRTKEGIHKARKSGTYD